MKTMRWFPSVLLMAILPLTCHASRAISDEDLSSITAQTGVSIFVDITMNIHIDCIAWGDEDGLGAQPTKASVLHGHASGQAGPPAISVRTNTMSPLVEEALRRYKAEGRVCFFPQVEDLDIEIPSHLPPGPPRPR